MGPLNFLILSPSITRVLKGQQNFVLLYHKSHIIFIIRWNSGMS